MKITISKGIVLVSMLAGSIFQLQAQTAQQIMQKRTFPERLVWIGDREPSQAENQELSFRVLNHLQEPEWTSDLEKFLKDHPDSPWAASLHYDYASFCRRTGRTTKALAQFEAAWDCAKNDTNQPGRRLSGTILGNWTDLLSSLGRIEELKNLMAIGEHWQFVNPADRDKFNGARHSYFLMQEHPEIAFRCGTFALKAVGGVVQPTNQALENLIQVPSPTNGFSMAGLLELAKQYGLNLVAVRRTTGQDLVVPSVVHWRQNHYAAILARQGDLCLVSDPTSGKQKWLSADVVNEEASGEFLVPAGSQPKDWPQLALNDAGAIHGMGLPNNINDNKDKGCQPGGPCPTCPGMPVWWVSEPYINLWMADEPISYLTSRGEPFSFRITFKQRDAVSSVSPEVTSGGVENSWYSFIQVDAPSACPGMGHPLCSMFLFDCDATLYLPNGGTVDYPAAGDNLGEPRFDAETRTTLQQQFPVSYTPGDPFANPVPLASGFDYGNNGIQIVHADGARDIYGFGFINENALNGDPPQAQFYLTRRIDAHGNTTWFNYGATNSILVLQSVVDCDGRTNTLRYTSGGLLSEVDNPYGQSAHFAYDSSGNLTNVVDAQGLSSSITYDASNNPTALITPYGTNTFVLVDNGTAGTNSGEGNFGNHNTIDRAVTVTDPTGATSVYLYRYDCSPFMSNSYPSADLPTNTPLGTLDTGTGGTNSPTGFCFRNSFYWGPRQFQNLSTNVLNDLTANDYLRGRMKHWLADTNQLFLTELVSIKQDPSPDGSTPGLLTFYDYLGKLSGSSFCEGTNGIPSVTAWRLPNGETHYEYQQFDYFGNVTNDITTYTLGNGSPGTRTNRFICADNSYTNLFSDIPNGGDVLLTNVFTVPDLLTKVIAPDGNTIWSRGGFDSMVWSNNYQDDGSGGTNSTLLFSRRVLPDFATNALNQVATFSYGNPLPQSDYFAISGGTPQLGTTFTGYNKVTGAASVAGLTTTNMYNASGFLARTIDLQIGRTNSFGYTMDGLVGNFTNELGLNVANTWDNLLRLTSVQYPDGTYVSNTFTKLDLTGSRDRLGNTTSCTYDGARHLVAVTNANNAVWQYDWCGCGALTGITDPLNNTTTLNYDNQVNLTNVAFPDGSALNYQYDLAARRISTADGAGRTMEFGYNNQGLVTSVSNAFGQVRGITYDIRDRRATVTDANNVSVTNGFDLLDRITSCAWPDGIAEGYGYSPQGLSFYTNRDNEVTRYGRDVAGRLISVTNANSEVIQIADDPSGDTTNLVDGLSHVTSWQYNQFGWLTNKIDGLGRNAFQYAYNANGWLTNRVTPEKGITAYTYDNVGNRKSIIYPGLTNAFAYDALNRLTNMSDAVGTTAFGYTSMGQLTNETGPWTSDTVSYTYAQKLRTALSLAQPSGSWSQSYGYDSMWRMTNLVSPAGTFTYSYNFQPASALISQILLPNAANITNSYDSLARLTQTSLNNYWGHTLDGYGYQSDPVGLRTNINRNFGLTNSTVSVGYDLINQLTSWNAKEPNGTARLNEQLSFGYDAAHNLHARTNGALAQSFNTDAANELTNVTRSGAFTLNGATPAPATNITVNGQTASIYADFTFASTNNTLTNGSNTFVVISKNVYGQSTTNTLTANLPSSVILGYDNNGNLTNEGSRSFVYDSENQLTNITVGGEWRSDFVFDGLNRRRINREYSWNASSWIETNETRYVYDGYLAIQERDTNNNPLATYTRGIDLGGDLRGAGGIGGLLARTDGNGAVFYHADANGNITTLMDSRQNIVARYLYSPFGVLLGQWGSLANANMMRFSSKEFHMNSGLYNYGYRNYEPHLQRWLNRDPIEELGDLNLYRFVENDSLSKIDPLGLQLDMLFETPPVTGPAETIAPEAATPRPVGVPPPQAPGVSYPENGPFPPEGTVENPNRPGSFGRYLPNPKDPSKPKFQECWRYDKGDPSKPGWGGIPHFHYWSGPEHMSEPLPPFRWFSLPNTINPENAPPASATVPPGVKIPPGLLPPPPPPPRRVLVPILV